MNKILFNIYITQTYLVIPKYFCEITDDYQRKKKIRVYNDGDL